MVIKDKKRRILIASDLDRHQALKVVEKVEKGTFDIISTLKDHHRSMVHRVNLDGQDLVYKIPSEKNTRRWIRFLTLFRKGEAFKNILGMQLLLQKGFRTTIPILACEYRKWGMVVDSWLLYAFLDGEQCLEKEETYPGVVQLLYRLHNSGLLHGDPQIRNFILKNNDLYIIDANPKTSRSSFERAYEFAYLRKSAPGIEEHFGDMRHRLWYKYAIQHDRFDRKLARFRRRLKSLIGLGGQ